MIPIPKTIQAFIDATNAGDHAAFLATFTSDAVLTDWGRTFNGRNHIADWDRTDNIGVQSHLDIVEIERNGEFYRAKVRVKGRGFNGVGTMTFQLDGELIRKLEIS